MSKVWEATMWTDGKKHNNKRLHQTAKRRKQLSDYTRCGEKYGLVYIDSEKNSNHGRPLWMSHPKSIYLYIWGWKSLWLITNSSFIHSLHASSASILPHTFCNTNPLHVLFQFSFVFFLHRCTISECFIKRHICFHHSCFHLPSFMFFLSVNSQNS